MNSTVLVVEDDERLASLVCQVLEIHQRDAEIHSTAASALEALDRNCDAQASDGLRYEALVTDYLIAGEVNGAELVRAAVDIEPALHCVIMSGHTASIDRAELPEHVELLQKPFSVDEFVSKVLGAH